MIQFNLNKNEDDLSEFGIYNANREIIIFTNNRTQNRNNKEPFCTKVIQTNKVLSKTSKNNNPGIFTSLYDSLLYTKTYHTFNAYFEHGIEDLNNVYLKILDSTQTSYLSTQNDGYLLAPVRYSSRFKNNLIYDPFNHIINNFKYDSGNTIASPKYYTSNQMLKLEGIIDIWDYEHINYRLGDIIDINTKILFIDNSKFYDLHKRNQEENYEYDYFKPINIYNASESTVINTSTIESLTNLIDNAIFIYDSIDGFNIRNLKAPLKSHIQSIENFGKYLNRFSMDFRRACKEIEEKLGNIRLYYGITKNGDHCKIYFRDFKGELTQFDTSKVGLLSKSFSALLNLYSDYETSFDYNNVQIHNNNMVEL